MEQSFSTVAAGTLYVVATPIGNLGDMSPRALETLRACRTIACEDTRTARQLLERYGISAQLVASHEHNEVQMASWLADLVAAGTTVGLMTDAGTPSVSDPGFRLVRECHRRALPVCPVPGPCAAIAALSASGLPSDGFLFLGFPPPKSAARVRVFQEYRDFDYTVIFYESTHRIEKFLDEMLEVFGPERVVCVARELTKLHEAILTGPLGAVVPAVKQRSTKGEFVVLLAKKDFQL